MFNWLLVLRSGAATAAVHLKGRDDSDVVPWREPSLCPLNYRWRQRICTDPSAHPQQWYDECIAIEFQLVRSHSWPTHADGAPEYMHQIGHCPLDLLCLDVLVRKSPELRRIACVTRAQLDRELANGAPVSGRVMYSLPPDFILTYKHRAGRRRFGLDVFNSAASPDLSTIDFEQVDSSSPAQQLGPPDAAQSGRAKDVVLYDFFSPEALRPSVTLMAGPSAASSSHASSGRGRDWRVAANGKTRKQLTRERSRGWDGKATSVKKPRKAPGAGNQPADAEAQDGCESSAAAADACTTPARTSLGIDLNIEPDVEVEAVLLHPTGTSAADPATSMAAPPPRAKRA